MKLFPQVDEKDFLIKESDENFDFKSLMPEKSQEAYTEPTSKTTKVLIQSPKLRLLLLSYFIQGWIKLLLDGELAEEDPKDSDYELPIGVNKVSCRLHVSGVILTGLS